MPFAPPRAPFVILVIALIGTGLVGLLLLNTSMQQGAFEVSRLQQSNAALAERQGQLERTASKLESPTVVTRKAAALGMVADPNPVFLRLSDGKILGKPTPAKAPPAPVKSKPANVKPANTKSASTKPANTKPASTKPAAKTGNKQADSKQTAGTERSSRPSTSGGQR